jgi:hypothetical protein
MVDEKRFEFISSSNVTVDCVPNEVTLNIDDLAMYLEVTDLLRCFQNVAIGRFLDAERGIEEGQREWVLNGLIAGIRGINTDVLKTVEMGCAPHCGTDVCFDCRPQIQRASSPLAETSGSKKAPSASKKSGSKKAGRKK